MTKRRSNARKEILVLVGQIATPIVLILSAYFFLEYRFVDEPIFDLVRENQESTQARLERQLSDLENQIEERQTRVKQALALNSSTIVTQIQRLERRRSELLLEPDRDSDAIEMVEAQIAALMGLFRSDGLPGKGGNPG